MRKFLLFAAAIVVFADDSKLTPEMQAVAGHISADSLRGHLSFIASDALEGRGTPSRGLDLAAEYIAAQFRRAGLEPAGDNGYFQTATLTAREQNPENFEFTVSAQGKTVHIPPTETAIFPDKPLQFDNVPIKQTTRGVSIEGVELPSARELRGVQAFDPEAPRRPSRSSIAAPELIDFLKNASDPRVTLHVLPPVERSAKVRNVAGILRGSDPALQDTYVMLTAHYDHLGTRSTGEDKIFNGANDDGSGTVSVMEIAAAIGAQNPHPKRSILFMTFFGEELGDLGSHYYGRHPLVPLANTIADLNLEQIGRTDDSEGPQVGTATVTGFDFSDMTKVLVDAGALTGIKVYKSEKNSDPYFARSDNQALADTGVPAHTLGVAFDFPDYHGVGDEWQKVDYANMAKVDRTVAIALLHFASDAPAPQWNASNPKTKKYVEAAAKLHSK
jgi:Peptidase family M28